MQISKQTWQLFTLLFISIAAYFYLQNEDTIKRTIASKEAPEKPSAFVDESQIVFYNKQGLAEIIIDSQTALFFKKDNRAIIQRPLISILRQPVSPVARSSSANELAATAKVQNALEYTKIRANKALYHTDVERLTLEGDVQINLPASVNSPALLIQTTQLDLNKADRFISTDQVVTIKSLNSTLQSNGLEASIDDQTIKLVSKVRGRYVPDPS